MTAQEILQWLSGLFHLAKVDAAEVAVVLLLLLIAFLVLKKLFDL